jgi:asparagine synthase (glutamine-hydrolysing)
MCGIAGVLIPERRVESGGSAELRRMLEGLARDLHHRGPDARGVAISGACGLAHTRLSILDLSERAAQPMWSADRRFALAYNGEVYNFQRLREALEDSGERFSGTGDTEVVLRLLVREGDRALGRLDGMFGLGLLDTRERELLLARDRVGQKPVYWGALEGGGFAFASELRPLLAIPGIDTQLDPLALSHLLSFGFVPAPYTLRRGIHQLEPGTWLRLRAGEPPREGRFVDPPGPASAPLEGDLPELANRLEAVLGEAVSDHLVADVPVGVLLSGGIDSSVVAALAARARSGIRTFTVVHRDPAYDESAAAREIATALGTEHHEVELPERGLSDDDLDVLVDHHGDPFADSSSLNVLALSREMRRHVTVALSGDGGDEVFAGYPRFAQLRWLSRLGHAPAGALSAASRAVAGLGGERTRPLARALHIAALPRARRSVAFSTLFWPEEQRGILLPEWQPNSGDALDELLRARGVGVETDPVAEAHWLEQRLHLPDDMLAKVDRMSMVSALEVRPPLLGGAVLDFARQLPFEAKNQRRTGKRILREVARRLLPARILELPKRGFALPLTAWGGTVLEEAARFAFESERSPLRELFDPSALNQLGRALEPNHPHAGAEDSEYRRLHRRWLMIVLARTLARQGV